MANARKAFIDIRIVKEAFPQSKTNLLSKSSKVVSTLQQECSPGAKARAEQWKQRLAKEGLIQYKREIPDDHYAKVYEPDTYKASAPCASGPRKSNLQYVIAPGVATYPPIPPTEVPGYMMDSCRDLFSEIMGGFGQYGKNVLTMTSEWCGWQSSVRGTPSL